MQSVRIFGLFLLVLSVLLALGCSHRRHLTKSHGKSTAAIFAKQQVNPDAGNTPLSALGLDSQEAAGVAAGYRKSLAPQQTKADQGPILFIDPSSGKIEKLAPSVPKNSR